MELTVGFFPALIKRVKPYEEMHEDLKKLLLAFSKRLKSKYYGPSVCLKVIKSFQYYAQVCSYTYSNVFIEHHLMKLT